MTQVLSAAESAGPTRGKAAREQADKVENRIFRLKHVVATDAARILRELFGSRRGLSTAVDERTNSLIISGGKVDLQQIEAILMKIDVEGSARAGDAPQVKVFSLAHYHVEPDEGLEAMVRVLIPTARTGKFTVDARRNVVVVFADQPTIERVQVLLISLRMERETKPQPAVEDLQLRLFWIVSGAGRRGGSDLPEDFKEIAGELTRLGMASPRLATQITFRTETGARFESAATVALAGSHQLTITGTTGDRKNSVGLSLTINVSQSAPRRSSRRPLSLRTRVSVPLDRRVLLGVTPGESLTSAFVIQVSRSKPSGLTGFEFKDAPWKVVFGWLEEQTGKPVIHIHRPTGTFTFRHREKKMYTIAEVVDILNEALTAGQQKHLLIQRERQFLIVPADERVDGSIPQRVSADQLPERGKTEIVRVVIALRTLQADDVVADVKKMLGPFGEAMASKAGNRLLLQDQAGNLQRIYRMLTEIEQEKKR
jgi:type II secretory pathway component GspD/PulD (secretin)